MDLNAEDQARIVTLELQARAYSELIHAARTDIKRSLAGMRGNIAQMKKAQDPRVRQVAEEVLEVVQETERDTLRALK